MYWEIMYWEIGHSATPPPTTLNTDAMIIFLKFHHMQIAVLTLQVAVLSFECEPDLLKLTSVLYMTGSILVR